MNKTQVLILMAIIALAVYYFSPKGSNATQPKRIDTASRANLPPNSPLAPEILYAPSAELFPDPPEPPKVKKSSVNSSSPAKKAGFTAKHGLSDQEIDGALAQIEQAGMEKNSLEPIPPADPNTLCCPPATLVATPFFKILEATQFMFAKAALETKDTAARFSFPTLLSELTEAQYDLVFIPVNNPDFHGSLLVGEQATKCFWHFDTLRGANDTYIKPLITELIKHLWQDNNPDLSQHLQTRYHLPQNNSGDCGIAIIEIARAIMKDYPIYQRILLYTKLDFNFPAARLAGHHQLNHA